MHVLLHKDITYVGKTGDIVEVTNKALIDDILGRGLGKVVEGIEVPIEVEVEEVVEAPDDKDTTTSEVKSETTEEAPKKKRGRKSKK